MTKKEKILAFAIPFVIVMGICIAFEYFLPGSSRAIGEGYMDGVRMWFGW